MHAVKTEIGLFLTGKTDIPFMKIASFSGDRNPRLNTQDVPVSLKEFGQFRMMVLCNLGKTRINITEESVKVGLKDLELMENL